MSFMVHCATLYLSDGSLKDSMVVNTPKFERTVTYLMDPPIRTIQLQSLSNVRQAILCQSLDTNSIRILKRVVKASSGQTRCSA